MRLNASIRGHNYLMQCFALSCSTIKYWFNTLIQKRKRDEENFFLDLMCFLYSIKFLFLFFIFNVTKQQLYFSSVCFPSVSGFHINSCCHLTAALQGLFSAAGSSLTPVCQGEAAMIEGEYDPAQTGLQHNSFYDRKSSIWLHLSCWKAVDWTSHRSYWGCPVNLKC